MIQGWKKLNPSLIKNCCLIDKKKVENKMKKRIINYRLKIDNLLANPDKISKEEWKKILQEHRHK